MRRCFQVVCYCKGFFFNAGEILKNSIKINELTPRADNIKTSYVLIGCAQSRDGGLFIVRSVVNRFTFELSSMDVLYAINAKKESTAALSAPRDSTPRYRTAISISHLFDYVNILLADIYFM